MVEISWCFRDIAYAADFHITEIFERDGSDMFRAYIRDQDHVRGGRPCYRGLRSGAFKDFWVNWRLEALDKAYTGKLRRAAEMTRRRAEMLADLADLPKARIIPKKVMNFFQMMAVTQAVGNYVEVKEHDKITTQAQTGI